QPASTAVTLRFRDGKVLVNDGPYAETKEQIGGILVLEADDLQHAIRLMSRHPGVRGGPFEIRPAPDLTGMVEESERRRARRGLAGSRRAAKSPPGPDASPRFSMSSTLPASPTMPRNRSAF